MLRWLEKFALRRALHHTNVDRVSRRAKKVPTVFLRDPMFGGVPSRMQKGGEGALTVLDGHDVPPAPSYLVLVQCVRGLPHVLPKPFQLERPQIRGHTQTRGTVVSCSCDTPVHSSDSQYSTCSLLLLLMVGDRAGICSIWVRIYIVRQGGHKRTVPVYSRAERTPPE